MLSSGVENRSGMVEGGAAVLTSAARSRKVSE